MRVIKSFKDLLSIKDKIVLLIGNFDGLHKGHMRIVRYAVKEAVKKRAKCFALTFSNHPACVLKGVEPLLLQTTDEKVKRMKELGIDGVLLLQFTRAFAGQSPLQFLKSITSKLQIVVICVGDNFYFGKKNKGDVAFLKAHEEMLRYKLKSFPLLRDRNLGITVSSSTIRALLLKGESQKAKQLLGYSYSITSEVVMGEQFGRTIGFPTANFDITRISKLLPKDGVYKVSVRTTLGTADGLTYIGPKTFRGNATRVFETWLKDYRGNLYGKKITIAFEAYIRPPIKFSSMEKLKNQIQKDQNKMNKMPRRQL